MRRTSLGLLVILVVSIFAVTSGGVFATFTDQESGGPSSFVTAVLNPPPTTPVVSNGGCVSSAPQQTNVGLSWTDPQSSVLSAGGSYLVSGYALGRAATSAGPYTAADTITGAPPATTAVDTPTIASAPAALVVDGTAGGTTTVHPVSESTLTSGAAITIGRAGTEPNAIQMTPLGTTAVIAESLSDRVEVLSWSGTLWSVVTSIAVTHPTAVAINPIPDAVSGLYTAYVVSYRGTGANGYVYPLTLNGASSALGTPIAVEHQSDPTAMVVTPDGGEVYVANYHSSTVSAINTSTNAVTSIALPGTAARPVALASTFDSSNIYVADRVNSYLDDIAVATNTVSTHIALPAGSLNDTIVTNSGSPNLLAMMPNGQSLYVAEWGSAQVQQVYTALSPTAPNTIEASVSVGAGSQPISISLSPNGCLAYVSDWPSDHIFSIVTSTNTEATAFTLNCQTQDPQPMEVTPDNLYLFLPGNYSCSSFSAYNTSTNTTTVIGGVGTYPAMVAIPPQDEWYQVTATHGLWSSDPSPPSTLSGMVALYAAGFNPGGWQ